jgi:hypothetical protein
MKYIIYETKQGYKGKQVLAAFFNLKAAEDYLINMKDGYMNRRRFIEQQAIETHTGGLYL